MYVDINVVIKPNWKSLTKLVIATKNCNNFEQNFDLDNLNKFKKYIEENFGETLVQNILNLEQIIDDSSKI